MLLNSPQQQREMMQRQRSFDFNDSQNRSHPLDLDDEQHQLLIEMMGEMVFHIFHALRIETNEHTQETNKD